MRTISETSAVEAGKQTMSGAAGAWGAGALQAVGQAAVLAGARRWWWRATRWWEAVAAPGAVTAGGA